MKLVQMSLDAKLPRSPHRWLILGSVFALLAARAVGSEYSDLVQSHGPVAYWRLGETSGTSAVDVTGAHNGTYQNSVTLASTGAIMGDTDQAANFGGGANDRVQVNPFGVAGTGITILAWFKPNGFGDDRFVAKTIGTATADYHWALGLDSGSRLSAYLKINGTTQYRTPTVSGLANGVWCFAALTYDGSTMRTYLNGVQVDTVSVAGTLSTDSTVAVALGNLPSGAGNRAFAGVLDDVAVYDKQLTATQIYDLYITGGGGLRGHWKLVETSGTTATDSSVQLNNGTYTNGPVLGAAGPFPGAGDKAANFDGSNDYVAIPNESLYDLTGPMSVAAWIKVDVFDDAEQAIFTKGNNAWRLQRDGSTNGLNFYCERLSTKTVASSANVNDGNWHHAVGVYTGSQLQIYIDGVLSNSANSTGSIQTNSRAVQIARNDQGASREFDGSIHDVRIYGRGLSATDVAKLYGFVGHWKLDQTTGATANDSSPFAGNGTVSGTANWSIRCTDTGVFDFDGSTNYISIPNASHLQPTSAMTIAGWVKGDSWGAGNDVDIILRKGEDNPNNYQLAIADGKVALFLDDSDSNGIRGNTTLAAGEWYHVAATWDGATVKIFVNGQLDNTPAARTGTIATDTRPLYIGGRSGADLLDGMIYDVRLYNRALYPADIAELAGLVSHWKLDETSGATAADSSGLGRNATVVGAPTWTTGIIDNALQLDGASRAEVTNLMGSPKNVTLAGWADLTAPDSAGAELVSLGDYFAIRLDEAGASKALFYDGSTWVSASASQTFTNAGWHHFAAVFNDDQNYCKLYIDGAEAASVSTTVTIPYAGLGTKTVIGSHGNAGTTRDLTGKTDDVRVYNRALCPAEIQALHDLGTGAFGGVKIIKWIEIQ